MPILNTEKHKKTHLDTPNMPTGMDVVLVDDTTPATTTGPEDDVEPCQRKSEIEGDLAQDSSDNITSSTGKPLHIHFNINYM